MSQDQDAKSGRVISVAQKEKSTKTEAKKPTAPRLPNNYGKLDLAEDQKERIKFVLGKYNEQIDELEDRIKLLKEKRDKEVQAVLTAEQKSKLAALETETKKKKSDKADKTTAEKSAKDDKEKGAGK